MADPAGVASCHPGGSNMPATAPADNGVDNDVPGSSCPDNTTPTNMGSTLPACTTEHHNGEISVPAIPTGPKVDRYDKFAAESILDDLEHLQLNQGDDHSLRSAHVNTDSSTPVENRNNTPDLASFHQKCDEEQKRAPEFRRHSEVTVLVEEQPLHDNEYPRISASSGCSNSSKGKQKQKAVHFAPDEPTPAVARAVPGPSRSAEPVTADLSVGDEGWERSPDRPPTKLPIQFNDAVGRVFVFPWEKAKTWEGMKRLIDACFLHVDVIGPHVLAGHFDLTAESKTLFASPRPQAGTGTPEKQALTAASSLSVADAPPPAPSPPKNDEQGPAPPSPSSSSSSSSLSLSSVSHTGPDISKCYIILPELWEDFAVPGMLVWQHMWPIGPTGFPPPPPPMMPVGHPGFVPGGRGRGRGGPGRGLPIGPPPPPPPPPPPARLFPFTADLPPRPKTRKKRE